MAACIVVLAAPAVAQSVNESPPGHAVARGFAPLPAPIVISVVAGDNSAGNLAIRERIVDSLAARGAVLQDSAPLVFRFDTEVREHRPGSRDTTLSREGTSLNPNGPRRADDSPDEVLNLFSSRERSLLRPAPRVPSYARALDHVINAVIEDSRTGRRLWQGHVSYATSESDEGRVFQAMVPHLLEELGKTTPGRAFTLD
jgi:hypothetical protein